MRRLVVLLTMFAALLCSAQRTTRKNLKPKASAPEVVASDTVVPYKGEFVASGFEKVQSSVNESFFVSNHSGHDVAALRFVIVYYNMRGEELHRRALWYDCLLPAGQTRNISLRSWDKQRVWHFVNTQGRHNAYSAPFDIKIKVSHVRVNR